MSRNDRSKSPAEGSGFGLPAGRTPERRSRNTRLQTRWLVVTQLPTRVGESGGAAPRLRSFLTTGSRLRYAQPAHERLDDQIGCVARRQMSGADRLGRDIDQRVERLEQPEVGDVRPQHAAGLPAFEHGQRLWLDAAPPPTDVLGVVEDRVAPQERQVRTDRHHRFGKRVQAAGVLGDLGERRGRIGHEHVDRDVEQGGDGAAPTERANSHVQNGTAIFTYELDRSHIPRATLVRYDPRSCAVNRWRSEASPVPSSSRRTTSPAGTPSPWAAGRPPASAGPGTRCRPRAAGRSRPWCVGVSSTRTRAWRSTASSTAPAHRSPCRCESWPWSPSSSSGSARLAA